MWLFADMVRDYKESFYDSGRQQTFDKHLKTIVDLGDGFRKRLLIRAIKGVYGENVIVEDDIDVRRGTFVFKYDPHYRTVRLIIKGDDAYVFEIRKDNLAALKKIISTVYPGDVELNTIAPYKTVINKTKKHKKHKEDVAELTEMSLVFTVSEKPRPLNLEVTS